MSAAEMHDFEKAMMDDPMLADAVDGFQSSAGKLVIADDLAELKERLDERNKKSSGIIIGSFRQWMSIAAALVVLLSTSVVLYRIFYHTDENKSSPAIAEVTTKKDSAIQIPSKVDSQTVAVNEKQVPSVISSTTKPVLKNEPNKENKPAIQKDNTIVANEQRAMNDQSVAGATTPPAPSMNEMKQKENVTIAKTEVKKETVDIQFNKFIGKVVDENNQPLPFANIKEKKSGIGTYADANGNFTLISADSILNVQTKYAGYFVTSAQIKSNQLQKIVLKDEAVIANAPSQEKLYEKNKSRPSAMKTEVNESDYTEPFDGWQKYNIYVVNNLRNDLFKDKMQSSETKQVEISFDVNPDGTIANFKVERSNCNTCNSEAIRLLKEGPKWKSKTGKKERSRYTVQF